MQETPKKKLRVVDSDSEEEGGEKKGEYFYDQFVHVRASKNWSKVEPF